MEISLEIVNKRNVCFTQCEKFSFVTKPAGQENQKNKAIWATTARTCLKRST
jgi:hypothetical protein